MRMWLLIVVYSVCQEMVFAQDTIDFHRIGTNAYEEGVAMVPWTDSSYLVLMNSGSGESAMNAQLHLVEIGIDGSVDRTLAVGSSASERGTSLAVNDSLIYIAGTSNAMASKYTGVIYAVDMDGNKYFELYPEIEGTWSGISQLLVKGDTLFAILGALNEVDYLVEVVAMDAETGQVYFQKPLSDTKGFTVNAWKSHPYAQGYVACGSFPGDSLDAFMAHFNGAFEPVWLRVHSLPGDDVYEDFDWFSDSNMIVTGWSSSYFDSDQDILIQRMTADGVIEKEEIQGYNINGGNADDRGLTIAIDAWDSIYISGFTGTYGFGKREIFLSRIDSALIARLGSVTLGTSENEWTEQILLTSTGMVGIGSIDHESLGTQDALFWRRDSVTDDSTIIVESTNLYSVDNQVLEVDEMQVVNKLPQISQDAGMLTFSDEVVEVIIHDISGRLICVTKRKSLQLPIGRTFMVTLRIGESYIHEKVITRR